MPRNDNFLLYHFQLSVVALPTEIMNFWQAGHQPIARMCPNYPHNSMLQNTGISGGEDTNTRRYASVGVLANAYRVSFLSNQVVIQTINGFP